MNSLQKKKKRKRKKTHESRGGSSLFSNPTALNQRSRSSLPWPRSLTALPLSSIYKPFSILFASDILISLFCFWVSLSHFLFFVFSIFANFFLCEKKKKKCRRRRRERHRFTWPSSPNKPSVTKVLSGSFCLF